MVVLLVMISVVFMIGIEQLIARWGRQQKSASVGAKEPNSLLSPSPSGAVPRKPHK